MTTHLTGYTSTTKSFDVALNFARFNCEAAGRKLKPQGGEVGFGELRALSDECMAEVPVVLEIHFEGDRGLFELTDDYTAYPGEDETLVQDGLQYLVLENHEKDIDEEGAKYRHIKLLYSNKKN